MNFLKKIVNSERDKIITDLLKEKRALEIETMEQDCEIRSLRAQLKLQSIAQHRIKHVIK
jgi:hypothetical protein